MAGKKSKPNEAVKLVWMEKDGERLEVHPTTVQSHRSVGWKVVENLPEPTEVKTEEALDITAEDEVEEEK